MVGFTSSALRPCIEVDQNIYTVRSDVIDHAKWRIHALNYCIRLLVRSENCMLFC